MSEEKPAHIEVNNWKDVSPAIDLLEADERLAASAKREEALRAEIERMREALIIAAKYEDDGDRPRIVQRCRECQEAWGKCAPDCPVGAALSPDDGWLARKEKEAAAKAFDEAIAEAGKKRPMFLTHDDVASGAGTDDWPPLKIRAQMRKEIVAALEDLKAKAIREGK